MINIYRMLNIILFLIIYYIRVQPKSVDLRKSAFGLLQRITWST